MSCPGMEILMRWLDGELPSEEMARISKHIESCESCRRAVASQRAMETAWREDWTDPDDTAFELMRRGLVSAVPWWRRKGTWFTVAAVFSVYLGVRVFYVDHSGRSMSQVVTESIENDLSEERAVEAQVEPADEVEHSESLEEVQEAFVEEEVLQEEQAPHSGETVTVEDSADFTYDLESVAGGTGSGGGGSPAVGSADYGLGGISGGIPEQQEEPLSVESSGRMEEHEELGGFSEGILNDTQIDDTVAFSSVSNVSGDAVSRAMAEAESCEAECPVSCVQYSSDAVKQNLLTAVLSMPDGSERTLHRSEWPELFDLLDSIFTGEEMNLSVDSTGLVEGPGVSSGTMIHVPLQDFAGCTVTVFFE